MGGSRIRIGTRAAVLLGATAALWTASPPALAQTAQAAAPRLELTVSAPSRVSAGEPVTLALTVTNRGDAPCEVAALAAGTVRVTGVTRDGDAVEPAYGSVNYMVSIQRGAEAALTTLQPGGAATLSLVAASDGSEGAEVELSMVDALPAGDGLMSYWALREPGRYAVSLVYSTPQSIGTRPCAGVSGVATASFVVGGSGRDGRLARLTGSPWIRGGAGAALLLLLALVALARRSRRRVPTTLMLVLLVAAGLAVPGSDPASAVVVVGGDPLDIDHRFGANSCLTVFRAKGGDPAGIMPTLDKTATQIPIVPRRTSDYSDGYYEYTDGRRVVRWSPKPTSVPLDPGVPQDPCANLYHELAHAAEGVQNGTVDERLCDHLDVTTTEARATLAENKFRASRKPPLPVRQTYSGARLPKNMSECDKRGAANDARKPGTCAAAVVAAPGGAPCDPDLPMDPPPTPPPAMSNGDPHLVTFDGLWYDFQAVGEFVAVRSASGDLEIQTRQSPFLDVENVSVNTAVGLRIGADRLSLTTSGGEVAIVLNGTPQRWERGTHALPGGGKVARRPSPVTFGQDGYTVRWPDGSRAWIDGLGPWALRLFVTLTPERAGGVTGLLGDFDGERDGDLVHRDGRPVGEPTFENLYPAFADGWRVTAAESLFAYGPGESTETFTDRAFPERGLTVADLRADQRDRARAVCENAGVTDPVQLDACILDVAVTGSASFAVNSGDVHRATAPPAPPPVVVPQEGDRTLTVDRPGGTAELTLPGKAGERIFVDVVTSTLPSSCGVLHLLSPGGETLGGGCVINGTGVIDTVALTATGTYTLRLDPAEDATGKATVRVFRPVDESGAIAVDGPAVKATVTVPGAVSRLSFSTAAPGQKVFVDVGSSTLPDECSNIALIGPGGERLNAGCVIGGNGLIDATALPVAGRYTILVDPGSRLTGHGTFRLTSVHDQIGQIKIGGPAVTAVVAQPGAQTMLRFTGTAGQQVVVEATESTLPAECALLSLLDAAGARIASGCVVGGTGGIEATRLPANGAYTLVVNPAERGTGRVVLRLRT